MNRCVCSGKVRTAVLEMNDPSYSKNQQILRRTKKIEAAHQGGRRDEDLHLASVEVEKWPGVADRVVVLLDDVVTTGSSMRACRRLLLDAGARRVICVAFAKTKWVGACGSRGGCEVRSSALLSKAEANFGFKPKRKERSSEGLLLDARYLGDVAFAKMESGEIVFIPAGRLQSWVLPVGYEVGRRVRLGYSSDGRFVFERRYYESSKEQSGCKTTGIVLKRLSTNEKPYKAPDFTFGGLVCDTDKLIREAFGISDTADIGEVRGDAFASFREIWESAQEDWDRSPYGKKGASALCSAATWISVVGVLAAMAFLHFWRLVDPLSICFLVSPCLCWFLQSISIWLVQASWRCFQGVSRKTALSFGVGGFWTNRKDMFVPDGLLGLVLAVLFLCLFLDGFRVPNLFSLIVILMVSASSVFQVTTIPKPISRASVVGFG